VIAYGCLIKRKGARREHLDYIYRVMSQHPHFTATHQCYEFIGKGDWWSLSLKIEHPFQQVMAFRFVLAPSSGEARQNRAEVEPNWKSSPLGMNYSQS